ncbi:MULTISPECIES: helix-turn-helix domain-containing protein [unclassified Sedimentibacter]|uniref:helix-turn-helix domain-containing protein n=1 Tax=unclassified Sedimentibacter TaxID=2649220 RepID=UPI0027DF25AD|nr:helix-turn-helix domain-containing protein [Sedimentibacter sp. MB35-C1]WMJ77800.1 helix-turn-helix domain-containing protein [Sedimentibacter sp. MB35-C1]
MLYKVNEYLKENIDENVTINTWNDENKLPLFLLEIYDFYDLNILGNQCILIKFINDVPKINDIKKHMKTLKAISNDNLVFLYNNISPYRRKALIQNRIPFIVENGQMYLPFLGLDLKKMIDKNSKSIEKFSSTAQLVFLYFLYNKDLTLNTTELAKKLNTTAMTASRALNDLYSLGILKYDIGGKTGKSKNYKRIADTKYFDIGNKYLKNPVNKVVYMDQSAYNIAYDFPIAGLEALSMNSMINPSARSIRAISKQKLYDLMDYIEKDIYKIKDMNLMELQIWDYDPMIFAKNNVVDLASLAASFSGTSDERIEQAIEESLKGELWYKG